MFLPSKLKISSLFLFSSTFIKFHPTKLFSLAVASYQGAITILDVQSKKRLFFDKNAHDAPIGEIAMIESSPDTFVSCGYDFNINVYDLRKRLIAQQWKQEHPMSTVCVSACGVYAVAGDLKGNISSYDFRNLKEPLDTKRAYDEAIVRVAFIPHANASATSTFDVSLNASQTVMPLRENGVNRQSDKFDSFTKFYDVCQFNNNVGNRSDALTRQDSWEDLLQQRRLSDSSFDSLASSPSRASLGYNTSLANLSELRLKRQSRNSLNQSVLSDIEPVVNAREKRLLKISSIGEEGPSPSETPKAAPKGRNIQMNIRNRNL